MFVPVFIHRKDFGKRASKDRLQYTEIDRTEVMRGRETEKETFGGSVKTEDIQQRLGKTLLQ